MPSPSGLRSKHALVVTVAVVLFALVGASFALAQGPIYSFLAKPGKPASTTVDAKGRAKFKVVNKDVSLGDDSHSVFSNGGTALVIHAKADDGKSDPAGNAGDRIACGVITK